MHVPLWNKPYLQKTLRNDNTDDCVNLSFLSSHLITQFTQESILIITDSDNTKVYKRKCEDGKSEEMAQYIKQLWYVRAQRKEFRFPESTGKVWLLLVILVLGKQRRDL